MAELPDPIGTNELPPEVEKRRPEPFDDNWEGSDYEDDDDEPIGGSAPATPSLGNRVLFKNTPTLERVVSVEGRPTYGRSMSKGRKRETRRSILGYLTNSKDIIPTNDPESRSLYKATRLRNSGKNGEVVGLVFGGVNIVVRKGIGYGYLTSKEPRVVNAVSKFQALLSKAEGEYSRTVRGRASDLMESKIGGTLMPIARDSVLDETLDKVNDKEDFITQQLCNLSENNAILTTQEVREVGSASGVKRLNGDTLDDVNEKLKGLEIQRTWFEGKVQGETDPKRATIFRVTKQLIEMKIDKLRLETNKAPLYEEVREVLEETAKTNEWTRLQRFWRWLKKNTLGTGGVAVTVVGVIFSIVYDLKSSTGSGIREVKRSLKQAQKSWIRFGRDYAKVLARRVKQLVEQ